MTATGTDPDAPATVYEGRFALRGAGLRQLAARGTLVNGAFEIGVALLGVVQGFLVALFLTTRQYGLWGILAVSLGTLAWLKQVGIGDKYIQQNDPDQEAAFHRAFTMEVLANGVLAVLLLAAIPVIAVAYGRWDVVLPGMALVLVLPAVTLQAPLWVHYRRLDFVRQRTLQAIDPVTSLVVAVALAAAGAGV